MKFPIQDGPSVPWEAMAPHAAQAGKNHGQTLERLAERGGLGAGEAWLVVNGLGLTDKRDGKHYEWDWPELKTKWQTYAERINLHYERLEHLEALLNTPEIEDFDKAVPLEAAHQVLRWGNEHDEGKQPEDWFWLLGYLAGKALAAAKSSDLEKAKHHCISSAAALRNWHAHLRSGTSAMRPGIEEPK